MTIQSSAARQYAGDGSTAYEGTRMSHALPFPNWIRNAPQFQQLKPATRYILIELALDCPHHWPDGSRTGATANKAFAKLCNVSKRSLTDHLKTLEDLGFITLIARGGNITAGPHAGAQVANKYGIPGEPQALDNRKREHRLQTMRPGTDGKLRPVILHPGDQVELFAPKPPNKPPDPSEKSARPPCKSFTTPSEKSAHVLVTGSGSKNHGSGFSSARMDRKETRQGEPDLRNITKADLQSTTRLLDLFRQAQQKDLVGIGDKDRLDFVAAACKALRVGKRNPAGLFYTLAIKKQLSFDPITNEDEQRAQQRLASHRDQHRQRKPQNNQDILDEVFGREY